MRNDNKPPLFSNNVKKNQKSRNPQSEDKEKYNWWPTKKLWLAHPISGNAASQLKQLLDHFGTERGMCLHYTNISFAANQCGSELVAFNAALALGSNFEF